MTKTRGLCCWCKTNTKGRWKKLCEDCGKLSTPERRKLAGICTACGASQVGPGHTRCEGCIKVTAKQAEEKVEAGLCNHCFKEPRSPGLKSCSRCLGVAGDRYQKAKAAVYQAYGGFRCRWCGITDPVVLSIDHVNNDGNVHRKRLGLVGRGSCTSNLVYWIERNNFPEGFQILCRNCNWAKSKGREAPQVENQYDDGCF